jgi:hypothetical protein
MKRMQAPLLFTLLTFSTLRPVSGCVHTSGCATRGKCGSSVRFGFRRAPSRRQPALKKVYADGELAEAATTEESSVVRQEASRRRPC